MVDTTIIDLKFPESKVIDVSQVEDVNTKLALTLIFQKVIDSKGDFHEIRNGVITKLFIDFELEMRELDEINKMFFDILLEEKVLIYGDSLILTSSEGDYFVRATIKNIEIRESIESN